MNPLDAAFGEVIATLRVARGISQAELAKRLGIAQGTVSKAERGNYGLKLGSITKIANALGVSPDQVQQRFSEVKRRRAAAIVFACIDCGRRYPEHTLRCGTHLLCLEPAADSANTSNPCIEPKGHEGPCLPGTPTFAAVTRAREASREA